MGRMMGQVLRVLGAIVAGVVTTFLLAVAVEIGALYCSLLDSSSLPMRIGLMRHFPVDVELPRGWKSIAELMAWRERYDASLPQVGQFDLGGGGWQACLASDMPRTRLTAQAVYAGEIETTPLLREPQFEAFRTGGLRLPILAWRTLLWMTWTTGHRSQRTCRDDFRGRLRTVADRLCAAECDTLVVSHAGMMAYLAAELRRRGFVGPRFRLARYATVYEFMSGQGAGSRGQ
ncbi:MAG: histidine phosphatase family protein [Pirellulales bacterium]|nr:histidine phosphatase family protein [Pirellulales bacterium]